MHSRLVTLSQRRIRRPSGYDLLRRGDLLYADHRRDFYFEKKKAGGSKTLQGFWVSDSPRHLHCDGCDLLYTADYLQTHFHLAGFDHHAHWDTDLFCRGGQKEER